MLGDNPLIIGSDIKQETCTWVHYILLTSKSAIFEWRCSWDFFAFGNNGTKGATNCSMQMMKSTTNVKYLEERPLGFQGGRSSKQERGASIKVSLLAKCRIGWKIMLSFSLKRNIQANASPWSFPLHPRVDWPQRSLQQPSSSAQPCQSPQILAHLIPQAHKPWPTIHAQKWTCDCPAIDIFVRSQSHLKR